MNLDHWDLFEIWYLVLEISCFHNADNFRNIQNDVSLPFLSLEKKMEDIYPKIVELFETNCFSVLATLIASTGQASSHFPQLVHLELSTAIVFFSLSQ